MKRILFVDDEPNILSGLRRMLRSQRKEWEMAFVEGGEAALEAMQEAEFDVVVSDMRMPGMDGAELLSRVQRLHPSAIRIVLSGHAEVEAALRAVPVAHQFLSKPCDAVALKDVLSRVCSLHSLLHDKVLTDAIGRVGALPSTPRVYRELTEAFVDPEVGLERVADIVAKDAAIAAKLLQLVNSSFFGICQPVNSIREATSIIGTRMIRSLVLADEIARAFDGAQAANAFSMERAHARSILSAQIATLLVPKELAQDQVFLAAMMHGVGELVLATGLPEEYDAAARAAAESGKPRWVHEEEILGVSYAEIGAYLLGLWGMPFPVVEAVAHHLQPTRVPQQSFRLLGSVHVAVALAVECLEGDLADAGEEGGAIDLDYLESLGVRDKLPEWRAAVLEQFGGATEAA